MTEKNRLLTDGEIEKVIVGASYLVGTTVGLTHHQKITKAQDAKTASIVRRETAEEIFADATDGLIAIRKFQAKQLDEHLINNPKDRQAKKEYKVYANAVQDVFGCMLALKDKCLKEKPNEHR